MTATDSRHAQHLCALPTDPAMVVSVVNAMNEVRFARAILGFIRSARFFSKMLQLCSAAAYIMSRFAGAVLLVLV